MLSPPDQRGNYPNFCVRGVDGVAPVGRLTISGRWFAGQVPFGSPDDVPWFD